MPNTPTRRTLRDFREAAGETQREAALASGIHWTTWSLIECGKANPSLSVCRRIAEHFGCTIDEIAFPTLSGVVA